MSQARRKLTVALCIALGVAAPAGVLIAAQSAQDLQKARHHHYHELGDAFKTVRDLTRADTPDMAKIKAAAQVINEASIDQGRWFPAGGGQDTCVGGDLEAAGRFQSRAEGIQRRCAQAARGGERQ